MRSQSDWAPPPCLVARGVVPTAQDDGGHHRASELKVSDWFIIDTEKKDGGAPFHSVDDSGFHTVSNIVQSQRTWSTYSICWLPVCHQITSIMQLHTIHLQSHTCRVYSTARFSHHLIAMGYNEDVVAAVFSRAVERNQRWFRRIEVPKGSWCSTTVWWLVQWIIVVTIWQIVLVVALFGCWDDIQTSGRSLCRYYNCGLFMML